MEVESKVGLIEKKLKELEVAVPGILHPRVMLYLITYVGISIGAIMFLTLIDALTPR